MLFKTGFSKKIILITVIFHLIIPFSVYRIFITKSLIDVLFLIILISVSLATFFLSPYNFIIEKDCLCIKYRIGIVKKYNFNDIKSVKLQDFSSSKIPIMLFGSGGIWGYIGYFYSFTYGFTKAFITDTSHPVVLINFKKKSVLISPTDPSLFYENLSHFIKADR